MPSAVKAKNNNRKVHFTKEDLIPPIGNTSN